MAVTTGAAALPAPDVGGRAGLRGAVVADHLGPLPPADPVPGPEPPHDVARTAPAALGRAGRPGGRGITGRGAPVRGRLPAAAPRGARRPPGDDLEHRGAVGKSARDTGSDPARGTRCAAGSGDHAGPR